MSGIKYFLVTDYQSMELLGVKGLFTRSHIETASLPDGFYKYSLREGRDDIGMPASFRSPVRYMGDFICKQEIDLEEKGERDLDGDYDLINERVDVDAFFGVDIKEQVARALDDFCYNNDYYEYMDSKRAGADREDVVADLKDSLGDKQAVEGIINTLKEIREDNSDGKFLSDDDSRQLPFLINKLTEINSSNRDKLDQLVDMANEAREASLKAGQKDGQKML